MALHFGRTGRGAVVAAALATFGVLASAGAAEAAVALGDYAPLRSSLAQRDYTFTTRTPYWSAVALRPAPGTDYDLRLTDGAGATLASSTFGGSTIDVIAINSDNCRAMGAHIATVTRFSGAGTYTVQLAQGSDTLRVDPRPFPDRNPSIASIFHPASADHQVVGVRDVYLRAGATAEVYVADPGSDTGEILIFAPDPNACVQRRSQALRSATYNSGAVRSVTLTFVPPRTGWYGFVQTTYGAKPDGWTSSLRVGQ